jgi:hypothetical protein
MGLREAQGEVAGMIRSGIAFDAIEDEIEEILDLDDEQRAALWLYAWSQQDRRWQRRGHSPLDLGRKRWVGSPSP